MKAKKILIALLFLTASVSALAAAGCSGAKQGEEIVKDANALNQLVTYYANGGTFDGKDNITVKNLHFTVNAPVINDFGEVQNISVEKDGYEFNGWHWVLCGDDGQPVLDADGNITVTETAVDFGTRIQDGEHWYFAATWLPIIKLEIRLATDDKGTMTSTDGKQYANGDLLTTRNFQDGVAIMDTTTPVSSSDYTFTQLFLDADCTQRVLKNIDRPEEEGAVNPVVYAQYLKGDWTVIRTASDVEDMLSAPSGKNYWISNMLEDKVIDCSTISVPLRQNNFSARLEGNGYTLTGITVNGNPEIADGKYSFFGPMAEGSVVRNLVLDNLTLNATTSRRLSVYLITSSASGATLENVSVKNSKLNLTAQNGITNIPLVNEAYVTDNWIFGGVGVGGVETDAAFLAAFDSVSAVNCTLTIGNFEYTRE